MKPYELAAGYQINMKPYGLACNHASYEINMKPIGLAANHAGYQINPVAAYMSHI